MKKKKNKNKSLIKKFTKVFLGSMIVLFTIASIAIAGYAYIISQYEGIDMSLSDLFGLDKDKDDDNGRNIKEQVNFVVLGVDDDGYRPDAILFGMFNTTTLDIDIISIPRDTRVELQDPLYSTLVERRSNTPRVMKINGVPAYSAVNMRNEYTVEAIEDLLPIDIEVDYYVKIGLGTFREVVDMIGGVEMYVPQDMYYPDPYQDLYINLEEGQQLLNGAQAEQLVRFRSGYADQDLGRIRTQQEFMKQFANQILEERNALNIMNIATTILESAETNVALSDALLYSRFIDDFDVDRLKMTTLPGTDRYIGGVSYFIMDEEETRVLFQSIEEQYEDTNHYIDNDEDEAIEEPISSIDKNIEVLNSTNVGGLAGRVSDTLAQEGFTIVNVDNYPSGTYETTRIMVSAPNMGEDLVEFFNEPIIEVNESLSTEEIDIRIIMGSNQ